MTALILDLLLQIADEFSVIQNKFNALKRCFLCWKRKIFFEKKALFVTVIVTDETLTLSQFNKTGREK